MFKCFLPQFVTPKTIYIQKISYLYAQTTNELYIMKKILLDYMSRRQAKRKTTSKNELINFTPGPVITISRDYGCHGSSIGHLLVKTINHKNKARRKNEKEWKFVSKEILEQSAKELNMSKELLNDMSFAQSNDIFSNMTSLFSGSFYASNTKIRNTIAKIIYSFADQGSCVIIGRASEAITKDIKRGLHVRLVAPLEVRAQWVADEEDLPLDDARKRCETEDVKRQKFRQYFEGKRNDLEYYDLTLNVSKMTTEEVVEVILILAEARGFL